MPKCILCGAVREMGGRCADGHPEVVIHSRTYVYTDYRDNLIVDPENTAVRRKAEKDSRIANENSEDALTWNVFRGLQRLEALDEASARLFGTSGPVEVYFWTLGATGDTWQPLIQAFDVLEAHIPPQRQRSEPDLILVDEQGQRVVFIEAKFGAPVRAGSPPKWFLADGGRYIPEYRDHILANYRKGSSQQNLFAPGVSLVDAIREGFYQLARHVLFANYIVRKGDCRGSQWTVVSLISPATNPDQPAQCQAFRMLLAPEWRGRYQFLTWRELYEAIPMAARHSTADGRLRQNLAEYLRNKTYDGKNAGLIGGR